MLAVTQASDHQEVPTNLLIKHRCIEVLDDGLRRSSRTPLKSSQGRQLKADRLRDTTPL